MARLFALVALALVACTNAFVAPATSVVATQQRAAAVSMFGGSKKAAPKAAKGAKVAKKAAPKKAAPKKAAPKKAVAKKAAPKPVAKKAPPKKTSARGKSPVGKGGILPWVTNAPGTYAKPLMLSSVDFLGADGDKWIGWGAMPDSVKALYNRKGRKGLLGGGYAGK